MKLCDFGIAKLLGDAPALGSEAGLRSHADGRAARDADVSRAGAPAGRARRVARHNQWSLGLVASARSRASILFGHVRGVPALVLAIATERMPPPSELAPHVGFSPAFDGWFLRSCARAPADRFPDVAAQVAALTAALGNPPPEALAPDGDGPRSSVHPAAATAPTVAARPSARKPGLHSGRAPGHRAPRVHRRRDVVGTGCARLDRHPLERRRRVRKE